MTEINSIAMERLNNGAHFLYVSDVLARAEADNKIANKLGVQVAALKSAVAQEDTALNTSQKSLVTDEIAKADDERDAVYSSYKSAVESFINMPIENLAKAARTLAQHIKDYNINTKMQMDKETGLLVNFIDDLESKFADEVAALNLNVFVTTMKEANERVRRLTAERTEERMTKTVGVMKESRKASDEAYRLLVKFVNAHALIEGETDYADFINYVNTEIVHYKREVIGRGRTASNTADETATEQ